MAHDDQERRMSTGLKLAVRDLRAFQRLARLRSLRGGKAVAAQHILRALALDYLERHREEVEEALALEQGGQL
jgi:hypothetical protein